MSHLATTETLGVEAMDLLRRVANSNPTTDVEVIGEFADVARLCELAKQLGWEEQAELRELYRLRAEQVRDIIDKGVDTA